MSGTTEDRLIQALEHQFGQYRIVVWYDSERKLREFFERVEIPGVIKLEIMNNEFGLKHRVLVDEPENQFLLFKEGPKPGNIDNWLLDIELAYTEFKADQASIYLNELGLGPEFLPVITDHQAFFESRSRRESLRTLLDKRDGESVIRLKMLSVCAVTKPDFYEIIESLITDVANDRDVAFVLIERCCLDSFFWKELKRRFAYKAEKPSVKDFAIQLFETSYGYSIADEKHQRLSQESLIFLQRWQASRDYH